MRRWLIAMTLLAAAGSAFGHDFEALAELLFTETEAVRISCPDPHVRWLRDNVLAGACATTAARFGTFAARFGEVLEGRFGSHVGGVGPWRYREDEDLYERTFRHQEGPYMAVRFRPAAKPDQPAFLLLVMTL